MKRYQNIISAGLLFAVCIANGWHLVAIQGYAWSQMYSEYSKVFPAGEAMDLTFSGKEVCATCEVVTKLQVQHELDSSWEEWFDSKITLVLRGFETISIASNLKTDAYFEESLNYTSVADLPDFLPPKRA